MEKHTNELIKESSPYLLQHAHNPVNWVPWTDDIFEKAQKEGKMVLVSVGYSACHWCHVMEHESFEDEEVATLMNKFFINVKVDREERPDVDNVYMTAVQIMTRQGGWPLNCFTLPDGRPIYGGTYFPKDQWMNILKSLHYTFVNELQKVEEYASDLMQGIASSELIDVPQPKVDLEESKLTELIERWQPQFDLVHGGNNRAPKFPLPNNLKFFNEVGYKISNQTIDEHFENTLQKMARGGIYDQIGGGFARYSVDAEWKVPHFEKMLYDNGQLLSVYANAYRKNPSEEYKKVIEQTIAWLHREMRDESGAFYSALDADSEGVEGKFYVWSLDELESILQDDFTWFSDYFNVNEAGFWEGNFILLRQESAEEFVQKMNWSNDEFTQKLNSVEQKLMSVRDKRIRPGLDNKCLTSWNAMLISGLCDVFATFQKEQDLNTATKIANWIWSTQWNGTILNRSYQKGVSKIEGFLEDYAHSIKAFIDLYQVTLNADWLEKANELTEVVLQNFQHEASKMCYFVPKSSKLIARKMELNDNVIPASNSVMANNLFDLGTLLRNEDYLNDSKQMLLNVYDGMEQYGSGYSNWGILLSKFVFGVSEVVFAGEKSAEWHKELLKSARPIVYFANSGSIPMADEKPEEGIYVCKKGVCLALISEVFEVEV